MKKCILVWLGIGDRDAFSSGRRPDLCAGDRRRSGFSADRAGSRLFWKKLPAWPCALRPPSRWKPGQSLEAIGRTAAATLGESDHSIIVLVRPTDEQPQGVCLPDVRFGALNLARLEAGVDAAQLERRIKQEGLRVMAMLLGMAPCPFPLCVLVGYEKTEDLERLSGSYCPPCQARFVRLAE